LGYVAVLKIFHRVKKKAGVNKPFSPKWLRHNRLTDLAKKVREAQLEAYAGWTPDSKMVGVYVHLAGMDTVTSALEEKGLSSPRFSGQFLRKQNVRDVKR